jgi:SPP1 gp7 family putative phage head morphogenesis protein
MRNRYSLIRMARAKGHRRNLALRPINATQSQQQELRRIVRRVPAAWTGLVERILPAYGAALDQITRDDANTGLRVTVEIGLDELSRLVLEITAALQDWVVRVEKWHRQRFADGVKASLGVDMFPFLNVADVQAEIDAALARNASLVRGLSDDVAKQVESSVWDALVKQMPRRELGALLAERLDVARSRADFIAKDQTLKLSGDLDMLRQTQAGITQFKWRTAEDDRVRPTHAALDGRIFDWVAPPSIGFPGQEPNCRCKAQAWVDLQNEG